MSTVVQNEDNDYDIDVAVVFEKSVLGDKGARATRDMVADALRRKTKQFNAEPEVKTSCVRVKYADGYHIDFAVYRRFYDDANGCFMYERAGNDWTERELKALTDWFDVENENSDGELRKVVRLSKMFCNSRTFWKNMPSGLIQTVLCDENLQNSYNRIDELFYHTIKQIVSRLKSNTSVAAPVDNNRDLTPRQQDVQGVINWKNRLKSKLEDLAVLFDDECTQEDALQAWYGFFNHEFWNEQVAEASNYSVLPVHNSVFSFEDTEEYIEDLYPVITAYYCKVSCSISGNGWRPMPISDFLTRFKRYVPHNLEIRCDLVTNCPQPYNVYWKVKNVGPEAQRRNQVRGQIFEGKTTLIEKSSFYGNHYIECYLVKNGICVSKTRIKVPIGRR
jgi:predicted nucleotidyltransferase